MEFYKPSYRSGSSVTANKPWPRKNTTLNAPLLMIRNFSEGALPPHKLQIANCFPLYSPKLQRRSTAPYLNGLYKITHITP